MADKIDLCSGYSKGGFFDSINFPNIPSPSLPDFPDFGSSDFSLPDFPDLPNLKMLNGIGSFGGDFLPDFTMFKIDSLKSMNMTQPFECNLKALNNPFGKNLKFKGLHDKLGNINCDDPSSNLSNGSVAKNVLRSALVADNCSKTIAKAVLDSAADIDKLGLFPSIENSETANTILDTVINDKFDVGMASNVLTGDDTLVSIQESISKSGTPLDKIMGLSKSANLGKDKDRIIKYAGKIADPKNIAKLKKNSKILSLSDDATKDSSLETTSVSSIPEPLKDGQALSLLSKASKMANNNDFLKLKSKFA